MSFAIHREAQSPVTQLLACAALIALASCAARSTTLPSDHPGAVVATHSSREAVSESIEVGTIRSALSAYNAHDANALVGHYAEDVKWFGVDSDGQSLEGDGRESLRAWLVDYFRSTPTVRSEISGVTQTGPLVSFREHAMWMKADGTKIGQSSIGVYEVRDGKIRRVWYYPAVRDPAR